MDGSASSDLDTTGIPTSQARAADPSREPTGGLPQISDYWPDAPQRTGPAADYYSGPGEQAAPAYPIEQPPARMISPPPPPRRPVLAVLLGALAVLVFVGGSVVVLGRMVLRDHDTATGVSAAQAPAPSAAEVPAVASPPVSVAPESPAASATPAVTPTPSAAATSAATLPFSSGTFELVSNVAELNVSIAPLGADPVRVTVPGGSGLQARLSRDGSTVRLTAKVTDDAGSGRIDVRLNSRVTWSVRTSGGMREGNFSLASGMIRRIDLNGGAASFDMKLPAPGETLPIRMTGGVNNWSITTAKRVPVKVLLRDGAGKVVLNGDRTRGIDKNTRLSADGDRDIESGGLAIDAVAGLGTLTVAPAE